MDSRNHIEVKKLSIGFAHESGYLKAVSHLDFTLAAGETVALLGESGCGKSITAASLLRLLPQNAAYGRESQVFIDQDDILLLPEFMMRALRGRRIAMIFQEPMTALNPVLTIRQQLSEAILHQKKKLSKKDLEARLYQLLEEVEIIQPALRLAQYPHQLSGGQKQRVVIAMALANNPEILIADEPTTALDATIQAQILKLLKKLQQQHNMSLLLITHDLTVVKAIADRVYVMYAGQFVEEARIEEFLSAVKHPYTQQLMAAIPGFTKRQRKLPVIPGAVPSLETTERFGCLFHPRCPFVMDICRWQEPAMYELGASKVRCHLYQTACSLPVLHDNTLPWPEKTDNNEVLLRVENMSITFKTRRHLLQKTLPVITAVENLNLQVNKGETLAVVGESGSGKTTLARAIMRLQKIDSGKIIFAGQEIQHVKDKGLREYRKNVQLIFQDPFSSLNPRLTVAEIIAEGLVAQGYSRRVIDKRRLVLLEQVRLPSTALQRYPHQFSGGQRQRIGIARALATEPRLLICDEPTSALDVSVQAQILNLLRELQYELGISYLFITHNMAVVAYIADTVLVMRHGKLLEYGTIEQILLNPQNSYTKDLLAAGVMA